MRNYKKKPNRRTVSLDIYKTAARIVIDEGKSVRSVARTFELCHVTLNRFMKRQKMDQDMLSKIGYKQNRLQNVDSEFNRKGVINKPLQKESLSVIQVLAKYYRKYTDDELNEIRLVFEETPYPTENKLQELAQKIGVSINSINELFRNLRQKKDEMNEPTSSLKPDHKDDVGSKSDRKSKKKRLLKEELTIENRNKLIRILKETRYLRLELKEKLAEDFGVSLSQIAKWCKYLREVIRKTNENKKFISSTCDRQEDVDSKSDHKSEKKKLLEDSGRSKVGKLKKLIGVLKETPHLSTKKIIELAQEMGVSSSKITKWLHYIRKRNKSTKQDEPISSSICERQEKDASESNHKKVIKKLHKKSPRVKRIFTDDQRNELRRVFKETPYPSKNKIEELAQKMGLSFESVNTLFQYVRERNDKMKKSISSSTVIVQSSERSGF
ncbi:PREDICTED: uncharacterized protein LOC108773183 isoform X2 [Cyphomyrmex costatus]|uniref:uncharacterized protein LOC108773183 isoform X2 n=1 Tax=Cyphomyrmex costatus TaxID=456900 RepID=UPI0008521FC0|nr:PREDICTED: uncharacterized protein LOC108773183 isoform X2 [Cyphomyrmex costatus]